MQRFAPLNSWPDNRNLDKARRLLWPVKKKYGRTISWADLMVFAGNRALETMGFTTFGFAGGRADVWEPDETSTGVPSAPGSATSATAASGSWRIRWRPTRWASSTSTRRARTPCPDPLMSARDIRETFRRMGMNDEETVALIVGRAHVRQDPRRGRSRSATSAPNPRAPPSRSRAWAGGAATAPARAPDTITSGLDGTWTPTPTRWDNSFLETLFGHEWDVALSPAGLWQWIPRDGGGAGTVPDAHDPSTTHAPTFLTTDLALRFDPVYEPISRRFLENPDQLADAFARVWFKLTHLDMGPIQRYLGPLVPQETLLWQDPVPAVDHELVDAGDVTALKAAILDSGLSVAQLVCTAWASASTFRSSDRRGGANGARIRLEPQRGWEVNDPDTLAQVLRTLEGIQDVVQQCPDRGQEDLAGRPHRARRVRRRRAGRPRPPATTSRSPSPRDARTPRRSGPTRTCFARARAGRGRIPQLPREGHPAAVGAPAGRPGEPAEPERARDDRPRRWPAGAGRELRQVHARRPHLDARVADQRLLREPARHGHGVDGRRPRPRRPSRAATAPPARSGGPRAASTSSSARTPSCGPSRRSTRATTRGRSSCTTSWPRGTRS